MLHSIVLRARGIWQRRWIGMLVAWIAGAIGVAVVLKVPERYEASARLYVDTQSLLRPLMAGISIQPNLDQQVALVSRTLVSRPNVEKLVRMADLDLSSQSESKNDDVVDSVMNRIQLSGNPTNNLYTIAYRDPNPEQSRKVVQSLVTIFVESSLGDKREDTVNAVKFLDEQIKRYEAGLRAAEDRLKAFRLKYLGVSGTGNQDYFTRLAVLTDQVSATRQQLRAAEESRDSYKRELAGEAPVLMPDVSSTPPPSSKLSVPALDARLAALQSELDILRRKYTDDHPDVTGTRRIIEQLEQQRKQEIQALTKDEHQSGGPASADRNPVYQQLKIALASAEANVASLRSTLASQEAQMARLTSSARLVPQFDAEFAQLNRDYDTQKKMYEALLARRESAALGEGVADAGGTRFRVIDPPRVSPTPVFPGRAVLLALAFVGALLAGVVAAAVANEMLPTVHDSRTLETISKRPVIGTLTMFPSVAMRRLRIISNILFAGAAGTLVAAYAGVFAFTFLLGRAL